MRALLLCACLTVVKTLSFDSDEDAEFSLQISSLRKQPNASIFNMNSPVLDSPNFLPLCGNGRIDTKADYTTFYKETEHPPLEVNVSQLFHGWGLPDAGINITIAADEECDDGNRLDFDGCSADCMHMDLWTPACELALSSSLSLESIIYDPVRNAVVVSALDGIYALYTEIGASVVNAVLIAGKSFPVTNIFRRSTSLILYSSSEQTLWQLADGSDKITLVRSFPELEKIGNIFPTVGSHNGEDGSIVVHDHNKMIYIKDLDSVYQPCSLGREEPRCIHFQGISKNQHFHCGTTDVEIGEGVCDVLIRFTLKANSNIWADMFDGTSILSEAIKISKRYSLGDAVGNFNGNFNASSDSLQFPEFWGMSIEAYHPMGGFIEITPGDPRRLWSANPGLNVPYFTGDPAVLALLVDSRAGCGADRCAFDNYPGYDITQPNPLKNVVSKKTWNEILQDLVDAEAAKSPVMSNFKELWVDRPRYEKVFTAFMNIFKLQSMPTAVLSMMKHPVTHNIWALQSSRLVEVSTSGVQIHRPDGKCIPSGVALCPKCQWAPNGRVCRPCSQLDTTSWSWNAVCKACSNSRRLLTDGVTITFVLKGDVTEVLKVWPSPSIDPVTSLISVSVVASDSIAEMRSIKTSLLSMKDVQVIMAPYVVVSVGVADTSTDNTGVVVAAVLIPCLAVLGGVLVYVFMRRGNTQIYRLVRR